MTADIKEEIKNRIDLHRTHLKGSFGMSEHRVALLQLLRTIDYQTLADVMARPEAKNNKTHQNSEEIQQLFKWGLNEALELLWNEQVRLPGVPLIHTFPMLRDWASTMLQCSGRLRLVEYGMEMARVGLGSIRHGPDSNDSYIFEYSKKATGVESIERLDASFFETLLKNIHEKDGVWDKIAAKRTKAFKVMPSLVRTWETHYIGYDSDPIIDDYYEDLSSIAAPSKIGWDAFPHDSTFGGIKFITYINCVRILMGFALKHLDFCLLLHEKDSTVDLLNIISVPSDWNDSCNYMSIALGVSRNDAEQVMQATVVNDENLYEMTKTPAAPYAPHYQIASGSVVRLITGCLDQPFLFLLRELRRRYRKDWDSSVDAREATFRNELTALLTKFHYIAVLSDNINITCSKGKTDIDVLVLDARAGVAGIFQLKWQDHFGASIRERESRKSNLLINGNAWIERISCWIEEGGLPLILRSLGVPKKIISSISDIRLFVLGRNYSHFSGDFEPDKRAAWGNWMQVVRLMHDDGEGKSALQILHDKLLIDSPLDRAQRPKEAQEIKIDDWKWIIQPSREWIDDLD